VEEISLPAAQVTCPAFGGADFRTLFATTAADGLEGAWEGKTYSAEVAVRGQTEHRVIL
jgi:sugar lactone lactonase YvrE